MKQRRTIEQLSNDPSFIRWIEGEAKRKENEKWDRWVRKSEQNRRLAIQAQQNITGFAFKNVNSPNVKNEWEGVHEEILDKKQTEEKATYSVNLRKPKDVSMLLKIAAVIVIGVFAGLATYAYYGLESIEKQVATSTIQTSYGQTKTIKLSDGTKIILAANSRLTYKNNWLKQSVLKIKLKGEAFFEVAPKKRKGRPKMVVQTKDGKVAVWGTRFVVNTYGTGTYVVLEEGEVKVNISKSNESIRMKPGEMAIFDSLSGKVQLKKVNPRVYTSWTTQELFFDNTPLAVLFSRIERTYGLEVMVQDSTILQKRLSGSVDFYSLDGLTNAVAGLFGFQIDRVGDTLIIN